MKFGKKTRYGLTALVDLAAQPSTTPVALKTIAERNDISLQFLEHIFASFRRTGIVKSVKGSQGGYNLAKDADKITVASVVEALEGSYHLEDEDALAETVTRESPIRSRNWWWIPSIRNLIRFCQILLWHR